MIENPPHLSESLILRANELLASNSNPRIIEVINRINKDYLYWGDVKYRANDLGIKAEELWALVYVVRSKTHIEINDFKEIHFALTNSMQRLCHQFDMNFGGSWGASKIFPEDKTSQELYLLSSIMEEAIASSQMEGAATTREVAKSMLRRKISPKDKSQRMILNNYNTINFIRQHAKENLTPDMIMEIHHMMTDKALDVEDAAGRFRRDDENIVVGNGITGETFHTPPKASCLPSFVDRLCAFFNAEDSEEFIHPIIRAIIIHYLMGYYHPFADGNGRTARALFYWYMMKSDYWLVQYLSISRIIKGSKKSYEKSYLYAEHDSNDIGYFIQYNLEVLNKSFEELRRYIKHKNSEKKKAERLLHLGNVSPRQASILNLLIENPDRILTISDISHRMGSSFNTAKSDLNDLVQKNYLTEMILGRSKGYARSSEFPNLIEKIKQ